MDDLSKIPSLNLARVLRDSGDVSGEGELEQLNITKPAVEEGQPPEVIALPLAGPLRWRASVTYIGPSEYWLDGRVKGPVNLECARCLEPVRMDVEARLESLLHHKPSVKTPHLETSDDGEEDFIVFGDPNLDLTQIIAEAFSMEIPLSVLHDPNCKGLCVACGTNLNHLQAGTCAANRADCPQLHHAEPDHPLAGLNKLRGLLED